MSEMVWPVTKSMYIMAAADFFIGEEALSSFAIDEL